MSETNTLLPAGPEQQMPQTEPQGPEQTFPAHTGEAPRVAGHLLTEQVTSIDWGRVESVIPDRIKANLGTTVMRHAAIVPAVTASLASRLLPPEERPAEVPLITAEQVKQERPDVGLASRAIGFFSPNLAKRFDRYATRKAQERIDTKVSHITKFIERIGSTEAPKEALIGEMGKIYDLLQNDKYGRRPEDILANLLWDAGDVWSKRPRGSYYRWLQENCPVIADSIPTFMTPALGANLRHPRMIKAIAPEIISGIQKFLEQSTGQPIEPIQTNMQDSLIRRVGMRYKKERIEKIPTQIAQALHQVHDILPDDGAKFKQEIGQLAREVAAFNDSQALLRALLKLKEDNKEKEVKETENTMPEVPSHDGLVEAGDQPQRVTLAQLSEQQVEDLRWRLDRIAGINNLAIVGDGLEEGQSRTMLRLPDIRLGRFNVRDTIQATAQEVSEIAAEPEGISNLDPYAKAYTVVGGKPGEEGMPRLKLPPEVLSMLDSTVNVGYVSATHTDQGLRLYVGCYEPATKTLYELPLNPPTTGLNRWH